MNLQLAEKLLEKQYKEKKLDGGGEYQLYLLILETRGDLKSALRVLDQPDLDLDSKLGMHNYTLEKRIEYLTRLGEWTELRSLCEAKLEDALLVDNWNLYLAYIESLDKTAPEMDEAEANKIIERFHSIQTKKADEKIQGPYLAKIEFSARRKLVDKCKTYLREYAQAFAGKPGFIYDLNYFAERIREFDLALFMLDDVLKPLCDDARQQPFKSIKSIYTCLSYFEAKRQFCATTSATSEDESAQLETLYKNALSAFGSDLLSTAYQYADELIILAIYNRLECEANTDVLVLQLISNIKVALNASPSNHQLKLLLINLYSYLGAYEAMQSVYDSMEIKNIQNYSISYLMLSQFLRLSAGSNNTMVSNAYQFFTSNLFDIANFLVNCYKYGTFLKLIEFIEFIQTVRDSFSYALCQSTYATSTHIILAESDVTLSSSSSSSSSSTLTTTSSEVEDAARHYLGQVGLKLNKFVRDNASSTRAFDLNMLLSDAVDFKACMVDRNDYEILYNWESADRQKQIQNDYLELIDEQRMLVKMRFLLVHFLTEALNLYSQAGEKENQQIESSNLLKIELSLTEFLSSINAKYKEKKPTASKINPFHPKSTYLHQMVASGLVELERAFVRLGAGMISDKSFVDAEVTSRQNKTLIEFKSELGSLFGRIRAHLDGLVSDYESVTQGVSLISIANLIESLSGALETVSFCLIIFMACLNASHVKPIWSERIKKSKKKKDTTYLKYLSCADLLYEIYEQFAQMCAYFILVLRDKLSGANMTSRCETLLCQVKPTLDGTPAQRLNHISSSYTKSIDDMRKCFVSKLKLLFKLASSGIDMQDYLDSMKSKF